MIFRKPYAFLIKNFRKIHILLFIICAFILYKTMQLSGFIKEFIVYQNYDEYLKPITKYTSILLYFFVIVVIIISATLLLLLRKKKKPWKLYLIPMLTNILLLILFSSIQGYFFEYEPGTSTATARAFRDFLSIGTIPQYLTFIILIIRIIGVDLKKFSFGNDQEFIELGQEDREEVEVNINFDKRIFKRQYKKSKRLIGYFYEEHKFIVNIILIILSVFIVGSGISYFLSHKTVKEDKNLNANGYSIRVNESYYTDKDKNGNILEDDSSFVILNLTVKNNSSRRKMNMNNFHIINKNTDVTYTGSTYSKYFNDIGKEYDLREFEAGEERTFALIFKVDKKLIATEFKLYYQQYKTFKNIYLRKIKLNLQNVSTITKNPTVKDGETIKFIYPNGNIKEIEFEETVITDKIDYNIEGCDSNDYCGIISKEIVSPGNFKILKIKISSNDFEGEEFIDFSVNYGKIKYRDNDNIMRELKIEDALENKSYLGKNIYIKIPLELEQAKNIEIVYTLRNQQYSYSLR